MRNYFLILFIGFTLVAQAQFPALVNREYFQLSEWQFKKGIYNKAYTADYNIADWQKVSTPHTYSMDAINEVGYYRGQAWYRSQFTVPQSMKGERIYIRFEGVGQEATLYVNEKKIGQHIGGYSAFCFDITDALKAEGDNLIAVKVTNEPNFKRIPVDDKLFNHYGGIYRPVYLFSTPQSRINPTYFASSGVFVETKKITEAAANIEVRVHLKSQEETSALNLIFELKDAAGQSIIAQEKEVTMFTKEKVTLQNFSIPNPQLWHGKANPHLYTLKVALKSEGGEDIVEQQFGIREFYVDPNEGFILNDEHYRLYGVAMHQEWKHCGPAMQAEHHRKDWSLIDEIGATAVRMSHYQHSELSYQLADSLGLVVWTEIPNVHDWSGREGANAKQQLKELIAQNYNHPSVCFWGLWNEVRSWSGKHTPAVTLVEELQAIAKELDPSRITTSASDRKMDSPMSRISDLQAFNKYYGWYYGQERDLGTWLDDTHRRYPEDGLAISEYGVGGNIYQQDSSKLDKPNGAYFPEMVQTNYHEVAWEIINKRPFVWGSYIWNMFDFSVGGWNRGGISNLNHKGLITYDRETKKDAFYFYKANWSDEPVLYIAERRHHERERNSTDIKVFTNLEDVTLFVNGKKVKTLKNESELQRVIFTDVKLQQGENNIKVSSKRVEMSDEVIWIVK